METKSVIAQPYEYLEKLPTQQIVDLSEQFRRGKLPKIAVELGIWPAHIRTILNERERAIPKADDALFLVGLGDLELEDYHRYWSSYGRDSHEVNAADDTDLANYWIALIETEISLRTKGDRP
jgi:hypothetical protein